MPRASTVYLDIIATVAGSTVLGYGYAVYSYKDWGPAASVGWFLFCLFSLAAVLQTIREAGRTVADAAVAGGAEIEKRTREMIVKSELAMGMHGEWAARKGGG